MNKKCPTCKQIKSVNDFYIDKSKFDNLAYDCKECKKTRSNKWHYNNLDRAKKRAKLQYLKNPESIKRRTKEWKKDNPEKVRINNKIYGDRVKKKYGMCTATIHRHGLKLALAVYDRAKRQCEKCGEKNDLMIHHIDGNGRNKWDKKETMNNNIDNLIVLCRSCHGKIHSRQYWDKVKSGEIIHTNNKK